MAASVSVVWNPVTETAFLAGAGVLGGLAGSSGAIGSLVSYPALLAVGINPLSANVTNAVAVVGSGVGSILGSRPELRGARSQLVRWSGLMAAGAAVGATLLLVTPGDSFKWIVPFLIAAAAALLLLQPRITTWHRARAAGEARAPSPVLAWDLFTVAVYEGYFGAASGIMTLALLTLTVEARLVRANAYKNAVLWIADVVAAVAFTLFGPVQWAAAIPLGLGFVAGGALGPSIARRVPTAVLRVVIAIAGFALAGWLLFSAARG